MAITKKKTQKTKKSPRIPYHYKPEHLTYEEWQIGLRRQFAYEQNFTIKNIGNHPVFSDFEVTNPQREKTYKIAIRTEGVGLNYCSCPDFAINTLGTCKHIEYTLWKLKKKRGFKKMFKEDIVREYSSMFLKYGQDRKVVLRIGQTNSEKIKELAAEYFDKNNILLDTAFNKFEKFLESALKFDPNFRCYKDAMDYIIEVRDWHKRRVLIDQKYSDGVESPKLNSLINAQLYQYQKEAVLFAARTGRCIIADEMGLGKTIEAIAATELMRREFGLEKALIICPTSLKYQWKTEIEKFTDQSVFVIEGPFLKRKEQYHRPEFFKIITYNVVKNDLDFIQKMSPDLVILDEAQRIKNWKTKTAQSVKEVSSPYTIVLTGTPLENRLEELHSIAEFVDRFNLGPLFRFLANHQILDDHNKIIGYKDLHRISKTISPILVRRTKKEVLTQLPKKIEKNYYVPVTEQQKEIHDEHATSVSRLVNKWRRFKFLSEKERQYLMIHLNSMRMVSDSTYILDQETRYDTKINELIILLQEIFETKEEKVVIFSQWERMTRLVAKELEKLKIGYQYLHGGVPSHKRKDLLTNFHNDPNSLVFLSTDAGGLGLNLQCASFVVNLDCPWNPAVLSQRIARVHRLGQNKPVNVINFISSGTIEEMMLQTLKFKKSVFDGVLDNGENEVFMGENKFSKFMKGIENIVDIQAKNEEENKKAQEEYEKPDKAEENIPAAPKKKIDKQIAGDQIQDLFTTGLNFLDKLTQTVSNTSGNNGGKSIISSFMEKDEKTGKQCLKIPVPSKDVLNKAASVLDTFVNALKNRQ